MVHMYRFDEDGPLPPTANDPWNRLRGALKDIYAELGGGENYLRGERKDLDSGGEKECAASAELR